MAIVSIVPTPIGNLQDITIRAITTLFNSDIILTEEVARTHNLLTHLQTTYPQLTTDTIPKVLQFNEFLENTHLEKFTALLDENAHVSLVSSAGTPLFSDPGFRFIQFALQNNHQVESLPGPTAAIPALTLSGAPTDQILFLGFLPRKMGKKEKIIQNIKDLSGKLFRPTVIVYESPHRLIETLEVIHNVLGDIPIAISRELTKLHEENIRLTVKEAIDKFSKNDPKGEFVIVFSLT